jgi:transposase
MTAEERIAQLEMELARERAEKVSLRRQLEQVLACLPEVEGQLAKDSHNSSKPPSSDEPT